MADNVSLNDNFICGVVEGFYGRPWTTEQRKDLFQKLKKWGVGCYVYAPKDDYKHRAYWRDLYTVEEAEQLGGLITAARDCGVTLYYALSPGLDMTYSSQKEISTLKRKLDQVAQCGCKAFALLFDDIEPDMSPADKEVFQSFAHAQVSITNEIFQHLGQPKFLVCPTQYCSARAVPNVQNSDYLNTLGSKLAPQIDIMWTGQKVVSRSLSTESIREITEVLRRPPVIWDNLHANDYDQKRVFLGPYQGRSPDLISQLRGVLTNPNCEYGANFIAINTLAQWSKCSSDPSSITHDNESMKLETESDEEGIIDLPENIYHSRRALRLAIKEWTQEFRKQKHAHGPIVKPQPALSIISPVPIPLASFNTCMATSTTTVTTTSTSTPLAMCTTNNIESISSTSVNGHSNILQPAVASNINPPLVIMNSLVSESKVISEPMDCNISPALSPQSSDTAMNTDNGSSASMQVETPSPSVDMVVDIVQEQKHSYERDLTEEDLLLMCDLFYLPFEHGPLSVQYLTEFNWLKSNAYLVSKENRQRCKKNNSTESKPEIDEWYERAKKMDEMSEQVNELFQRLTFSPNRELVHDLYPYVWDVRCIISLLNFYVKWLSQGHFPQSITNYTLGSFTWFSKGWKENFMSGDQEPWVFRGGLVADLQRLMPVDNGSDLFMYKPPDTPVDKMYNVRPYTFEDESAVYNICRCTNYTGVGEENNIKKSDLPDLIPDRLVGAYLTLSPEFCFVVEDNGNVIGYALAALNAKDFYQKMQVSWLPEMCSKYPLSDDSGEEMQSVLKECTSWFHSFDASQELPDINALSQHKSVMTYATLPVNNDSSVFKRLIICLLAALRANGSFGVHVPLKTKDRQTIEFYTKMGFMELLQGSNQTSGSIYLGRVF